MKKITLFTFLPLLFLISCAQPTSNETKPAPVYSDLKLYIQKDIVPVNEPLTVYAYTSDKRNLHNIAWTASPSDSATINKISNIQIEVTTTNPGQVTISAKEENTNKTATITYTALDPHGNNMISVGNINKIFVGQTIKDIPVTFFVKEEEITPALDKITLEGNFHDYFTIEPYLNNGQINLEITAKKEAASYDNIYFTINYVVPETGKKLSSCNNTIISTLNTTFTIEQDYFNFDKSNAAADFTVKITKDSPYTKYKYVPEKNRHDNVSVNKKDNPSTWIKLNNIEKQSDTVDIYNFTISENDFTRYRTYKLYFAPDKPSLKEKDYKIVTVKQDKNRNPEETMKWVYGIDDSNASWIEHGDNPTGFWDENGVDNGWYNVNKINPGAARPGNGDGNMCWVMSTASMLQWWVKNNEDLLTPLIEWKKNNTATSEKYKEHESKGYYDFHYTPTPHTEYQQNSQEQIEERTNKSGIGKTLREVFKDNNPSGGFDSAVLRWFLLDKDYDGFPPYSQKTEHFGLVKEIFTDEDKYTEFNSGELIPSRNVLNTPRDEMQEIITTALDKHQAISLNRMIIGHIDKLHYINIWGVGYDKYGDIISVYIADNNFPQAHGDGAPSTSYLIKYGVDFEDVTENHKRFDRLVLTHGYDKTGRTKTAYTFYQLTFLDLGREKIKAFLDKNNIEYTAAY